MNNNLKVSGTINNNNQLNKYVDNNKKFIFLETHLFHSKRTLEYFSTDTIVEYIIEFTDYYIRVYRDKNNNIICKRLLQCILKLVKAVWLDKKSSSDSLLIVIDSMFKLIINVETRDSIDVDNLIKMLDFLCQNKFFSQNRGLIDPMSPLSPTRMINNPLSPTSPTSSVSTTTSTSTSTTSFNTPTKNIIIGGSKIMTTPNSSTSSSSSYSVSSSSSSSFITPTKNKMALHPPNTPHTPLNGMIISSPPPHTPYVSSHRQQQQQQHTQQPQQDLDDSFNDDDSNNNSNNLINSLSSSLNHGINSTSPIPFNHVANPTTLKESYILLIPLLFLYCKNDKNYRELKKFFGNNIIENETYQYFTTYWSITTKPDDYIRCSNFILSLGNNSYLLKDNKLLFLNTIFNIINSYDILKDKGIECLELHLMNFLDVPGFYERIIQEVYKHQEKFLTILKKLFIKDPKIIGTIIEPHFSKLFKLFQQSSSFSMLNLLIKSVGKSFFKNNQQQTINEYITKLIQIPITSKLDNNEGNNNIASNSNNSSIDQQQQQQVNNNNNNNNEFKKYEVLESIVYLINILGGKEMIGYVRILMKHFKTIEWIRLDGAKMLEYESIIRSLVLLYKVMGESFIHLFYIAVNSIVKSGGSNDRSSGGTNEIKHTGGMVILGEILSEFSEQLRLEDTQIILKFISSTCLCKREGLFPIFLDFYYRHSSMYEFNCYIERILQKDIKSNIDDNFNNLIIKDENDDDQDSPDNGIKKHTNIHHTGSSNKKNKETMIDDDDEDDNGSGGGNIDDDCKIKSFINTLQFIKVIGKYCPNAYTTDSQRERIRKIYSALIEKLPQSVVNVFLYAGKKSVRFIYLLIPQLTSLIDSLPGNDDIYTQFMDGILQCIYKRKCQDPSINITPFIELMLILNNEYVPGSKSIHYDAIIKQNLLFYKNYYGYTGIDGSGSGGGGGGDGGSYQTSSDELYNELKVLSTAADFSLFIDRRNPRFLLFLNQVLPLSSYKFLKKLVISYPAQLSSSIAFKSIFDKLSLKQKESIVKIIQSSSSYNPSLADLLKSLKRPIMPLADSSFKNGYKPLLETIYNCGSSSNSSNSNSNGNIINIINETQFTDCTSEWKMSLSLVCRDWFIICSNLLSNNYETAKRMKIKTSIKPGVEYCLFERIIHFSFKQILTYPMEQWKDIFKNSKSIDLSINSITASSSSTSSTSSTSSSTSSYDLQRHLDILADIIEFPNLIHLSLDSITSEGSTFNRIIDNLSNNPKSKNLKSIEMKFLNLNHSEVDNIIEFFQSIYKNKQQQHQDNEDSEDSEGNGGLKIKIEILNTTCEYWLLPLVNSIFEIFENSSSNEINITCPYPDDKFLNTHLKRSKNEIFRYLKQCKTFTISPGSSGTISNKRNSNYLQTYELFDYYPLIKQDQQQEQPSNFNKLIIQNCGIQGERFEFGINFELNLLALLENSKTLKHLQINNITSLYQIVELFSCLPLNQSLISITLIINTLQLTNINNKNNKINNNNNNNNNNKINNIVNTVNTVNTINNNNTTNTANNNNNNITNNCNNTLFINNLFNGNYFKDHLIQIFQLLNLNSTIYDFYISTHNQFPLIDDWNLIGDKGDFILVNPCHFQRKFKK